MNKILSLVAACTAVAALTLGAASLEPRQQAAVKAYTDVSTALSADNLAGAKAAASALQKAANDASDTDLATAAGNIASADTLAAARAAFKAASADVVALTKDADGYFHMYCPMAKADWVQTNKDVSNPYMGAKMSTCGTIVSTGRMDDGQGQHHMNGMMMQRGHRMGGKMMQDGKGANCPADGDCSGADCPMQKQGN